MQDRCTSENEPLAKAAFSGCLGNNFVDLLVWVEIKLHHSMCEDVGCSQLCNLEDKMQGP